MIYYNMVSKRMKRGGGSNFTGESAMESVNNTSRVMSGGRHHRTRKHSRRHRKGRQSGGFLHGVGLAATIKEALVPFGLYALQKRKQRSLKRNKYRGKRY